MANKPLKTIQFPGLSDTYTIPTKVTDLSNDANYATTSAVSSAIASAIGGINSFDVAVVTALPTQDIKDHTIYFVAKESEINDVYDEFMYIDNSWEKIGSTAVDLSGYATESYVDAAAASVSAAIPNVYSWALASSKPTYTYTEVGAASAAHTHTYSDVGALSAATHIPNDQVNADWNASSGVSSILNKPIIPAAQVNADWSASTGVASILNKPSIPDPLPAVTSADNDKVLKVVEGMWAAQSAGSGLPAVTSSDNGKFLKVVNGAWAAASLPTYNGGVS